MAEHLRSLDREWQPRRNHGTTLGQTVAGGEERYVGARMLSAWYERTRRILETLWRATDESADRALLVIGAAHVRVLDHLLDETPTFRPVDALSPWPSDETARRTMVSVSARRVGRRRRRSPRARDPSRIAPSAVTLLETYL